MAVYKVIQDIEAEDKLLGPLGFKGLVYAGIAVTCGFINFKLLSLGGPAIIKMPLIIALALPMILFGVLASPLGRDQPTEVWLLARLRFFLKPRLRVWDQFGITNLVTITVPKKINKQLTKGFTQSEVNSRLQALATTLDSRGWAVKHVSVNINNEPSYLDEDANSDRLITTKEIVRDVPVVDVHPADDVLDERSNPTAQNFQSLIAKVETERKQERIEKLRSGQPLETTPPPAPAKKEPEEPYEVRHPHDEKIHDVRAIYQMHRPLNQAGRHHAKLRRSNRVTSHNQAAKLELAQSGNDLSVASIAALANRG